MAQPALDKLSAGARTSWQLGADFALATGSPFIEPVHLLYGILSMGKHADSVVPNHSNKLELEEVRAEADALLQLWRDTEPTLAVVRQAIRSSFSNAAHNTNKVMNRSASTKQIFERAQANSPVANSMDLLRTLVQSGDPCVAVHIPQALQERIAQPELPAQASAASSASGKAILSAVDDPGSISVAQSLDATTIVAHHASTTVADRLARLCELTWEFGVHSTLDPVLQRISEEVLKALPAAQRASVLLIDKDSHEFLLKAHAPAVPHSISYTCARRAVDEGRAFLWYRGDELTNSQRASDVQAGIYSPLIAEGKALGVICIDTASRYRFTSDDLFLVTVMAHQLALAIANRNLQLTLASNAEVLQRLLTNFSPQVRRRLLEKAERGRLRLGGERSKVSILCSDIRGFTRLSANMDAEDVVNMLNDYFSALTECIFRNDGCIDKFVGDAILAVFGSPEPDPQHRLKAVKAAAEMQQAMAGVSQRRKAKGEVACEIGIGVHSGEVLHGFIGSLERMEYTVIGDAVNKAARYCDAAKGGEVILSPEIHQHVWRNVVATQVAVPTKHEGELPAHRLESLREL